MEKQLEARKKKLQQEEGATVNRQFHCTVPGCERVLKTQKGLNSHLQSNAHISAEDRERCLLCVGKKSQKTFTPPSLEVHRMVQHNVRTSSSKEAVLFDSSKKAKYDNQKDKESGEESPDDREEDSYSDTC